MKLERLYEDEDYIIINKPARLLSIQDRFDGALPSARSLLQEELKQPVFVVHRLDRETSGIMAFAKHEESHRHLSVLFEHHDVGKFYAGLVLGTPSPEAGRIEAPIARHPSQDGKMCVSPDGKHSVTDYKVVESWPLFALMQWQIHTGRTHQVRVHMSSIGHPIVCDSVYGDGKAFLLSTIKKNFKLGKHEEEERPLLSRLALHAYRISFVSASGKEIIVEAPLPKDIVACISQLRKHATRSR